MVLCYLPAQVKQTDREPCTLYAETINGVHEHGDDTYVTDTIDDEDTFFDMLSTLSDGEYIKCDSISQRMRSKIDSTYGIRR